tara:strand:+ start:1702 stop:2334 length:633 start_codon:yes stop_codon:yes gene_type:complete
MCDTCFAEVGTNFSYGEPPAHKTWQYKDTDETWFEDSWKVYYIRDRYVQELIDHLLFSTKTPPIYTAIVRSAIQEYVLNHMSDEDIYHFVDTTQMNYIFKTAVGIDTGRMNCCRHQLESCECMDHEETAIKDAEEHYQKISAQLMLSKKRYTENKKRDGTKFYDDYRQRELLENNQKAINQNLREIDTINKAKQRIEKMKQRNLKGYDNG